MNPIGNAETGVGTGDRPHYLEDKTGVVLPGTDLGTPPAAEKALADEKGFAQAGAAHWSQHRRHAQRGRRLDGQRPRCTRRRQAAIQRLCRPRSHERRCRQLDDQPAR